jgi:hypothetical protein
MSSQSSDARVYSCREHPTRLPITSRVWFFPTLILLMPLLSRACLVGMPSNPRPAHHEEFCYEQYEECVKLCKDATTTDCAERCRDQRRDCLDVQNDEPSDEWTCDITDWGCTLGDSNDYDYSEESTDEGGFDCSADNYDEGESDGDDGYEWGEDWGERSPAGGDGYDTPNDLPTE